MFKNPSKGLSGFTLVELLVAMAIIGVLIALAIFGIGAAQRNSRDVARKSALSDINVGIQDLYSRFAASPTQICFDSTVTAPAAYVKNGGTASYACVAGEQCVKVPFKGTNVPSSSACLTALTTVLPLNTDLTRTQFCWKVATDGYALGAQLETQVGSVPAVMQNLGTSLIAICP